MNNIIIFKKKTCNNFIMVNFDNWDKHESTHMNALTKLTSSLTYGPLLVSWFNFELPKPVTMAEGIAAHCISRKDKLNRMCKHYWFQKKLLLFVQKDLMIYDYLLDYLNVCSVIQ